MSPLFFIGACLIGLAAGEPPVESLPPIPILSFDLQPNNGDGSYSYSYETGNGIKAQEVGQQKVVGEPDQAGTAAQGSYSYTDPDGNLVSVSYTADERGFVPVGDHLPTPHPIPQEILKALEQNAAEEAAQNNGQISPSYSHFFRTAYPKPRPGFFFNHKRK